MEPEQVVPVLVLLGLAVLALAVLVQVGLVLAALVPVVPVLAAPVLAAPVPVVLVLAAPVLVLPVQVQVLLTNIIYNFTKAKPPRIISSGVFVDVYMLRGLDNNLHYSTSCNASIPSSPVRTLTTCATS